MKKESLIIFALVFAMTFSLAYPVTGEAIETENETITAGVTPDSIWYGLDVALDNINLALTSKDKKAEKGLEIARERLLEVRQMIGENKIEQSLRAQERHKKVLVKIEESIEDIEYENSTEEIKKEIKIEKEIEEHKDEIEKTKEELKLKIKVEGEISNETQALIDSILEGLGNSTKLVEIKIDQEKGRTKIKIKEESGKAEVEIEREVKEMEDKEGLSGLMKEKAEEMLKRANDKWLDLEEKSLKYNQTIPSKETFDNFITLGDEAFSNESYERAKDYYEMAKDYAESLKEEIEELEEFEEEEEIEIEVEIKGQYAEVKVKALGEEVKFKSNNIEREKIIEEISERTGLSVEEIVSNLKFEIEDEEEEFEEEEEEEEEEEF
jgi:hypothetical protein